MSPAARFNVWLCMLNRAGPDTEATVSPDLWQAVENLPSTEWLSLNARNISDEELQHLRGHGQDVREHHPHLAHHGHEVAAIALFPIQLYVDHRHIAFFGAPVMHSNDTERAVRAGEGLIKLRTDAEAVTLFGQALIGSKQYARAAGVLERATAAPEHPGQAGRHLVHDAHARAYKLIFRPLTQTRELASLNVQTGICDQRAGRRDLDRGRRAQSRSDRHFTANAKLCAA